MYESATTNLVGTAVSASTPTSPVAVQITPIVPVRVFNSSGEYFDTEIHIDAPLEILQLAIEDFFKVKPVTQILLHNRQTLHPHRSLRENGCLLLKGDPFVRIVFQLKRGPVLNLVCRLAKLEIPIACHEEQTIWEVKKTLHDEVAHILESERRANPASPGDTPVVPPIGRMRLLWRYMELNDKATLIYYRMPTNASLYVMWKRGGVDLSLPPPLTSDIQKDLPGIQTFAPSHRAAPSSKPVKACRTVEAVHRDQRDATRTKATSSFAAHYPLPSTVGAQQAFGSNTTKEKTNDVPHQFSSSSPPAPNAAESRITPAAQFFYPYQPLAAPPVMPPATGSNAVIPPADPNSSSAVGMPSPASQGWYLPHPASTNTLVGNSPSASAAAVSFVPSPAYDIPRKQMPGVPPPGPSISGVPMPGVPPPGPSISGVPMPGVPPPRPSISGVPIPGGPPPGPSISGVPMPGVPPPRPSISGVPIPGGPPPGPSISGVPMPGVPPPGPSISGVPMPGVPPPRPSISGVPMPGAPPPGPSISGVPMPGVPPPGPRISEVSLVGNQAASYESSRWTVPAQFLAQHSVSQSELPDFVKGLESQLAGAQAELNKLRNSRNSESSNPSSPHNTDVSSWTIDFSKAALQRTRELEDSVQRLQGLLQQAVALL